MGTHIYKVGYYCKISHKQLSTIVHADTPQQAVDIAREKGDGDTMTIEHVGMIVPCEGWE